MLRPGGGTTQDLAVESRVMTSEWDSSSSINVHVKYAVGLAVYYDRHESNCAEAV